MKLNKNDFVLYYDQNFLEDFKLCLVSELSEKTEATAKVVIFERINEDLKFIPKDECIIEKSHIIMKNSDFVMYNVECEVTNTEKVVVQYNLNQDRFKKSLKSRIVTLKKKLENALEIEEVVQRIVGKKSDQEIRKKIKVGRDMKAVLSQGIKFFDISVKRQLKFKKKAQKIK